MLRKIHPNILILIILISVLAGTSTHLSVQKYFRKFDVAETQSGMANRQMIVFRDVNRDGKIERFRFHYKIRTSAYHLDVYDESDKLLRTWKLPGRWQKDAYSFYDLNNDKMDELYAFVKSGDSIKLCAFDIRKQRYEEYFLFKGKAVNNATVGYKFLIGKWMDIDNDGMADFVFALKANFDVWPVGVMAFSPATKRILQKSEYISATPHHIHFVDLDGDHMEEIIWSTGRTMKTFRNLAYPASSNWIFILDQKFKNHTYPIEFPQENSFLQSMPIRTESGTQLLVANLKIGDAGHQSSLSLYNRDGLITRTLNLGDHFYKNQLIKISRNGQDFALLHRGDDEHVFEMYDTKLKKMEKFRFPYGSNLFLLHHTILQGEDVIFIEGKSNLYLSDNRFNLLASFPLEIPFRYYSLSDFKVGDSYFLGVSTFYRYQLLKITPNSYYPWRVIVFLPVSLIVFFLLVVIYKLFFVRRSRMLLEQLSYQDRHRGVLLLSSTGVILFMNPLFRKFLFPNGSSPQKVHFIKNAVQTNLTKFIMDHSKMKTGQTFQEVSFMHNEQLVRGKISCVAARLHRFIPGVNYFEFEDYTNSLQVERLKTWSESVRKMVHDIKTPLATIGINIETLRLKLSPLEEDKKGALESNLLTIENEIHRVRNLSQQFLVYTDLNTPKFEEINLQFILEDCLQPFIKNGDPHIEIIFNNNNTDNYSYMGDARQLKLAFNVFIENGLQSMEKEGTLTISMTLTESGTVEIQFRDTGPGIPDDIIHKIFEPFFTTKKGGSGLGLAMARKTIEEHGGEISVETPETGGTIFTILFYRSSTG